jgi:hypothetical protein
MEIAPLTKNYSTIRPVPSYTNSAHQQFCLGVGCLAGNSQFGNVTRVRIALQIAYKPITVIIQLFFYR